MWGLKSHQQWLGGEGGKAPGIVENAKHQDVWNEMYSCTAQTWWIARKKILSYIYQMGYTFVRQMVVR